MQRSSSRNVHGKTNLSRAAVSHYLQILKDAGILKMRRECTKNYYYFDADAEAMNFLNQYAGARQAIYGEAARPQRKKDSTPNLISVL